MLLTFVFRLRNVRLQRKKTRAVYLTISDFLLTNFSHRKRETMTQAQTRATDAKAAAEIADATKLLIGGIFYAADYQ